MLAIVTEESKYIYVYLLIFMLITIERSGYSKLKY